MNFSFKTLVPTVAAAACLAALFGQPATAQEKKGVAERSVAKQLVDLVGWCRDNAGVPHVLRNDARGYELHCQTASRGDMTVIADLDAQKYNLAARYDARWGDDMREAVDVLGKLKPVAPSLQIAATATSISVSVDMADDSRWTGGLEGTLGDQEGDYDMPTKKLQSGWWKSIGWSGGLAGTLGDQEGDYDMPSS